MHNYPGFGAMTALYVVIALSLIGGGVYATAKLGGVSKVGDPYETEADTVVESVVEAGGTTSTKIGIAWKFDVLAEDATGMPRTRVTLLVSGEPYEIGTYNGTCSEVGATGGIDGKGLIEGEVAAAQCYFAGGGEEIGVFEENGKIVVKEGVIDEGSAETAGVRGGFKLKLSI